MSKSPKKSPKPSRKELIANVKVQSAWKRYPDCQSCNIAFNLTNRRPFILLCGHLLCEICCETRKTNFKCKFCITPHIARCPKSEKLSQHLDVYMVGALLAKTWDDENPKSIPRSKSEPAGQFCYENCGLRVTTTCRECDKALCKPCFEKIHLAFNTLKGHVFIETDQCDIEECTTACEVHSNTATHICLTCDIELCSECDIQRNHRDHNLNSIAEMNRLLCTENVMATLEGAIALNETGLKDCDEFDSRLKGLALAAADKISRHFSFLHSQLQCKESAALGSIQCYLKHLLNDISAHRKTLAATGKDLKHKQAQIQHITSMANGYYKPFIDDAVKLLQKPCGIEFPHVRTDVTPFTVKYHDKDVETHLLFEITEAKVLEYRYVAVEPETVADDVAAAVEVAEKPLETIIPNDVEQLVRIISIVSPFEIYIQLDKHVPTMRKILRACEDEYKQRDPPSTVSVRGMYLVRDGQKFYRGRVIEEISRGYYTVELIDTAKSMNVPITNMREMANSTRTYPTLARKVAIYGIKIEGDVEAATDFLKIYLNGAPVYMYTYGIDTAGVKAVDIQPTSNYMSARNALKERNLAALVEDGKNEVDLLLKNHIYTEMAKKAKKVINVVPAKFFDYERFKVSIAAVTCPNNFYVVEQRHWKSIVDLTENLLSTDLTPLILPMINHFCLALVDDNFGKIVRAKILSHLDDDTYTVFLIDYGHFKQVPYNDLRVLPEAFCDIYPAAIPCCLVDIAPCDDEMGYPSTANAAFRKILRQRDGKIVASFNCRSYNERYQVALFLETTKNVTICINTELVRMGHAVATGLYGRSEEVRCRDVELKPTIISKAKRNQNSHIPVDMLEFKSPSEFYVLQKTDNDAVKALNAKIQESMMGNRNLAIPQTIEKGQLFLVSNDGNWRRGRIVDVKKGDTYVVVLIDSYKQITVTRASLAEIPKQFANFESKVMRCCLSKLRPSAGSTQWQGSAIDFVADIIASLQSFAISNLKLDEGNGIPVTLWGEKIHALSHEWVKINDLIHKAGYAILIRSKSLSSVSSTESGKTVEKSPRDKSRNGSRLAELSHELECLVKDPDASDTEIDKARERIQRQQQNIRTDLKAWPEAELLQSSLFTGIPTYVTLNGYIHIRQTERQAIMQEIKKDINYYCKDKLFEMAQGIPHEFVEGQPVIAEYHGDHLWHRAVIIKELNGTEYIVQFVDYGNVEFVAAEKIISCCIDYDIPIQSHKFKLKDIQPVGDKPTWTWQVIDQLHNLIVQKNCTIRCFPDKCIPLDVENGITPCEITVAACNTNTSEYLIAEGLAKKSNTGFAHQKLVPLECDLETKNDESSYMLNMTFVNFNPEKTSSRLPSPVQHVPSTPTFVYPELDMYFKLTEINASLESFEIIVARAVSVCALYVIANLDTAIEYDDLFNKVQAVAPTCKNLGTYDLHTLCFVRNPRDMDWYRGIIVASDDLYVWVFLVDTLDVERFAYGQLKRLPKEFQNFPLRCFKIQVSRKASVEALQARVEGVFHAKIVGRSKPMRVELYKNVELTNFLF